MKTKLILLLMGAGLMLASCTKYPPSSDRLLEDLAVITQYDTKVNFNSFRTYSLVTSIVKITNKDTTQVTNSTAMAVLDQVGKDMQARGFVPVVAPAKPDLGIQVVYYENTYVYTYTYDYWGYPYYGWYYPYYPVYYSSYTAGMLNIDLVDLKTVTAGSNKLYVRWNAYVRGLLTGTHTTSEITGSVHQAFVQTPQLQTTAQ
ncbi:MAG: DUF4136 domain-containing protein [Bacteroidota bacterium]